jgi:hypothetical protein
VIREVPTVNAIKKYIKDNVFCRCGQAVSRLVESNLVARPEMPTSESEVHEWWLVSPELAAKLSAGQHPVLQFGELYMWGRSAIGVALEDDEELIAAIAPPVTRPRSRPAIRSRRNSA